MNEKIAVIGLGYVGLPLGLAFAHEFDDVIGFDVCMERIQQLKNGYDCTGEADSNMLSSTRLRMTTALDSLSDVSFIVVTVPTPIDSFKQPDLRCLEGASRLVGSVLKPGTVVVYESTVYPGVTEEFCGPILEQVSGLKRGMDFTLGYSPERINPGDRHHSLQCVVKVVSGEDEATLERVANVYGAVLQAGIHKAPSIKVAEAAKVIENTQRDLNIALMNELAMIFDRMGIRTSDVLEAAGTKWNFHRFTPGLVGGHCIGVDPYYLTAKAEQLGYHPQVILAGRRINDGMGAFVAQKTVKLAAQSGMSLSTAKVGIFGLTFKENVPDIRNSRVPDIVHELHEYGIEPMIHDPLASAVDVQREYGLRLSGLDEMRDLDVAILAVPHKEYVRDNIPITSIQSCGVVVDIRSALISTSIPIGVKYWRL